VSDESLPTELKLPWRRWAMIALRTMVIGYGVVILFFTLFQRWLVYVPTRLTLDAAEQVAAKDGFVPWRDKTGQLMGWKSPAGSAPVGSVLIAHGNGGWALNRAYMASPIHAAAPLDVYILEYPGYGARVGSPSEASVLAASDEAFDSLPKNLPVYLVSESLGAGVVAHLAQKNPGTVAGLALFVPYDKLASVAENHVPFIPAYFLLWDRFNPARWLEDYHGPIEFVIAGSDEIIPPILGQRLYDGYQGPKAIEIIAGARHNETTEESAEWWENVLAFWRQNALTDKHLAGAK
jgi:pimeloyl-ACP methyl ester carboxylesterase